MLTHNFQRLLWQKGIKMSITLEELCPIYKAMLPRFTTLLEEATHYGTTLEVSVSPNGNITFTSKETDNGVLRYNSISQGKDHVGESCFSYKLGNKTIKER